MTTAITHSFKVVNKPAFTDKLKSFARRFKVEYEIVWGETFREKVVIDPREGFEVMVTYHPCDVNFSFDHFQIEGFSYLGCIKDNDMMGFVTIHGSDLTVGLDLSDWVKSFKTIPCHACNRKHSRKIGHLFQETATGEIRVFGSSCAKKYFGINFDRVLRFYESININEDEWFESDMRDFAGGITSFKSILIDLYYLIDTYGYVSRSKSDEERVLSTADQLILLKDSVGASYYVERDRIESTIDFSALWNKSYTKDVNNKSDFDHNVEVIQSKLRDGFIGRKDTGMVAFMVWNEFFRPAPVEKVEYTIPEGVVAGDKIDKVVVEFAGVNSFDSTWGTTFINVFVSGNVRYKCFSSVNYQSRFGIEKGAKLFIKKATVKDIEDNDKFGKSVIISRPSIHQL